MIKVVRGNPTPEELAAALAVVQARTASGEDTEGGGTPLRAWADPARSPALRPLPRAGAGVWRTAFWPN
ncbi:acyl-CoA carboxylase subunit epsilon [Streptomyces sp. PTM05]|uniref:Acyl-CoA carboxylase subunit epsilon n=1 Tax=Streptantibioticus parmotrematis TaxID=2873249 RepID=A0ABS7QM21_9ACTN|nr:acyl-CoA carboxylase subunit epsilon [Streptantibioticus parmotrematis]MBY8883983.1 acyl-CoA carboxylase subunit epsilon [Streptantibioticus parmotrematis]